MHLYRYFYLVIICCIAGLSIFSEAEAIRIVNPIEVNLKIEDGDFRRIIVNSVTFAGEDIPLDPVTNRTNVRKTTKCSLLPGKYRLEWVTQGDGGMFNPDKTPITHRAVIQLEDDDAIVYIYIRAAQATVY